MALVAALALAGLAPGASAFDPTKDLGAEASAAEAYAYADQALRAGQQEDALKALEFAADRGHAEAQWRLAKMYAEGVGVKRNDFKAFEYFRRLADRHAEDNPLLSSARIVSESFVELASYYLSGIPDTKVAKNLDAARHLLTHAATYFGDAEAQYQLGEIYREGRGVTQSDERAASWLLLAAKKQHAGAMGRLGELLVRGGTGLRPRPLQGLKFLELARRHPDALAYEWIEEVHARAFAEASAEQRGRAVVLANSWSEQFTHAASRPDPAAVNGTRLSSENLPR